MDMSVPTLSMPLFTRCPGKPPLFSFYLSTLSDCQGQVRPLPGPSVPLPSPSSEGLHWQHQYQHHRGAFTWSIALIVCSISLPPDRPQEG